MDVLRFKFTYTTKFILPLLFDNITDYHKLFSESFLNAYIADVANSEHDDKIHLLFADYPSLSITNLLPEPISEYTYGDGYVVLVYDIPHKFEEDYIRFLTGQYSHFSDNAKEKITKFWDVTIDSVLWGVLYKEGEKIKNFYSNVLKEDLSKFSINAEWWVQPAMEEEILGLVK